MNSQLDDVGRGTQVGDVGSLRYRAVLSDPIAGRLFAAATISYLGDFVGLGALLLIGYNRSGGQALGSAAVFGVQAIPAFIASAAIGPWLDRIPRRPGMVWLCLTGAAALALPIALPGLWPVLGAAAIIGAVRTVFNSLRTGSIADGVPRDLRGRLVALMTVSNQVCEVLGYLAGAAVAIATGAVPALTADAATFVAAAVLISGLRLPAMSRSRQRSSMTTGIRAIFGDRTLAVLAPVAWIGLSLGALPQTLAAAALSRTDRGCAEQDRPRLGARGISGHGRRPGHRRHAGGQDGAQRAGARPVQVHDGLRGGLPADRRGAAGGSAAADRGEFRDRAWLRLDRGGADHVHPRRAGRADGSCHQHDDRQPDRPRGRRRGGVRGRGGRVGSAGRLPAGGHPADRGGPGRPGLRADTPAGPRSAAAGGCRAGAAGIGPVGLACGGSARAGCPARLDLRWAGPERGVVPAGR